MDRHKTEIDKTEIHKGGGRGHTRLGWLDSRHSFTFGDHVDPHNMDYGPLRVINEDLIQGGTGFGMHGHRDMEIISYVLSGELAHKDNIGNGSVIGPGDVQRMSAGAGVMHSEYNHSPDRPTHFLQIWIAPSVRGIPAGYEQKHYTRQEKRGRLKLILSPDGANGALTIHQDALVYAGLFDGGEAARYTAGPQRRLYLHVARGELVADGVLLQCGDALKTAGPRQITLSGGRDAEVLLFDLA